MAWEESLVINGVTSADLIAGANTETADYGRITILGNGETSGILNNGSIVSGGTVSVSSGGVATTLSMTGNGTTGGTLHISSGGTVDGLTVSGRGTLLSISANAILSNVNISSGARIDIFAGGAVIDGGTILACKELGVGVFDSVSNGGSLRNLTVAVDAHWGWNKFKVYTWGTVENVHADKLGTRLQLLSHATARNITVTNGATLYLVDDTTGFDITLSGMGAETQASLNVLTRGRAERIHVEDGGSLRVGTDGTNGFAFSGFISSGGNFAVGKGGQVTSMTLYDGASGYVSSGGTAFQTTLSGGWVGVSSSGVMSQTTLSGGSLTLSAGGVMSQTTVSGGILHVSGLAVNASAVGITGLSNTSYGTINVYNGGYVSNIDIRDGAKVSLATGGTISGGTIAAWYSKEQWQTDSAAHASFKLNNTYFYGTVEDVLFTLTSNDTTGNWLWIYISGNSARMINCTVEREARLQMRVGGTASNCTVSNTGRVWLFGGTAIGTVVKTAGNLNVCSADSLAVDTVVSSGGLISLGANNENGPALASRATILSNGTARVAGGAILTDVLVSSGGSVIVHSAYMNGTNYISAGTLGNAVISGGAALEFRSGGVLSGALTFNFSGCAAQEEAILAGGARITSDYAPTLHVAADRAGSYYLAGNISGGFDGFYVTVGDAVGTAKHAFGSTAVDFDQNLSYTVAISGGSTRLTTAAYTYTEIDTAKSIFDAGNTVADAKSGAVAYTGKISVGTAANYFAAGNDTGSKELWLEIANGNHTGVIAAGGASGGTVGAAKVKVTGGTTKMLLGGGDATAAQTEAEVAVTAGTVATLYGGGKQGGYADGIRVALSGGTATEVGTLYAGVLHTKGTGDFTVNGAITVDVTGGKVTGLAYGGGKVSGGTAAEMVTFANDINITVAGGSFNSGVYALGYAASLTGGTVLSMAPSKAVNVTIGDGSNFASNVYLGALADGAIASGAALNATITGGTIRGALVGGGFSQKNGASNAGAVTIRVSGGEIASIIGGGSHVNNDENSSGSTSVASVTIDVSGGSIGSIYAGGHYAHEEDNSYYGADTVTGNAVVTLSGDATVDKAAGSWRGIDTVTGQRKLVFNDYTGTCGTVCDWDLVTFGGENDSTVNLASASIFEVGKWSFDVVGREAAAGTALVNLGDGFNAASTVDLHITDAATSLTSWSLAGVGAAQSGLKFNVYDETSTEIATKLVLGQAITGEGTFAGYGFSIDNGTLKFALISA